MGNIVNEIQLSKCVIVDLNSNKWTIDIHGYTFKSEHCYESDFIYLLIRTDSSGRSNYSCGMKTVSINGANIRWSSASCQLQHIHIKELHAIVGDDGVGQCAVIIEVM